MTKRKTTKSEKIAKVKETAETFNKQLGPRSRILIILCAIAFAIIIIYSVTTLIFRAGKTKTIISFAPNAAKIIAGKCEPPNMVLVIT